MLMPVIVSLLYLRVYLRHGDNLLQGSDDAWVASFRTFCVLGLGKRLHRRADIAVHDST